MSDQLIAQKREKNWIVRMPSEMSREIGVAEGSLVILQISDGSLKVKVAPPPTRAPRILQTNLPIRNRSREDEWLAKHRDKYAGQYVALDGDTLLAHGKSLKEVGLKARKLGCSHALLIFVEDKNTLPYVGF